MAGPRVALDHLVILVEDLDGASAALEREGFTVTPRTEHSAEMGTANRCVMFERSYLELLAVTRPTERNAGWRELMAAGGGVRGIALSSTDIGVTARRLEANGIPASAVMTFSRQAGDATLRFSVVRIDRKVTPGVQVLVCQHHTPELLWRPAWCRHENGARTLDAATLPADEPDGVAELFRLFGASPEAGCAIELTRKGGPAHVALGADERRSIDLSAEFGLRLELTS